LRAFIHARREDEARAELSKWDSWTHDLSGTAGRARWLDVPPLRNRPRCLWQWHADANVGPVHAILATPYASVVGTQQGLVALDGETGAVLWGSSRECLGVFLLDSATVAERIHGSIELHDIATGRCVGSLRVPDTASVWVCGQNIFTYYSHELVAYELGNGASVARWSLTLSAAQGERVTNVMVGDKALYVGVSAGEADDILQDASLRSLDLATGRELWRRPGTPILGDRSGVVVERLSEGITEFASDGSERWKSRLSSACLLAFDLVLAFGGVDTLSVVAIERSRGAVRDLGTHEPGVALVCGARDVYFLVSQRGESASLEAVDFRVGHLWKCDLVSEGFGDVAGIGVGPGRVYLRTLTNVVICLA